MVVPVTSTAPHRLAGAGRLAGADRYGLRRPQQVLELAQLLLVGGPVSLDGGGEGLLVGADELLFVAGLDGEVNPGQVRGLGAGGIRHRRRELGLVGRGAYLR